MKYIIDRNSLINLQRYYLFDKNDNSEQYEKFRRFFENKFDHGEIIIIDKVDKEGIDWIKKEFSMNSEKIVSTEDNLQILQAIANYNRNINPNCTYTDEEKNTFKREELKKADLSLIAYCKKLKDKEEDVCLITEETKSENFNKKLYKKIPTICQNYSIDCCNIAQLIFDKFKDQINFTIKIKEENRTI